jgi:hypothetical protein
LLVGSLSVPDLSGGAQHVPLAMLLTVDVDQVPGFREVLQRQEAGEEFDVVSRWAALTDEGGGMPPQAILDFYLPDFDLGVEIYVDVDEHPRSLQAAIQTGHVMVMGPDLYERLQHEDEIGAKLDDMRIFTVQPPDPTPIVGLLHQRFDLPQPVYRPDQQKLSANVGEEAAAEFLEGARPVTLAAVSVRGDGPVTIALVDPESASLKAEIPSGAKVEGRWGAIVAGGRSVLAFDIFAGGKQIGRWVIGDPPAELVRAGSHGAHGVGILTELSKDDQAAADRQWSEGIHAWVTHVEALRQVRFRSLQNSGNDT